MIMNVITKGHKYTSELSKTKQSKTKQVSALDAIVSYMQKFAKSGLHGILGQKIKLACRIRQGSLNAGCSFHIEKYVMWVLMGSHKTESRYGSLDCI